MKHSSSSSQMSELTSAGLAAPAGRRPTRRKRHSERMRGPHARTISLTYNHTLLQTPRCCTPGSDYNNTIPSNPSCLKS